MADGALDQTNDVVRPTRADAGRWLSPLAGVVWALLVLAQLGVLPGTRYAWAFNFWRYLPDWSAAVFALAALTLCFRRVRLALLRRIARAREMMPSPRMVGIVTVLAFGLAAWLLRERHALGDAGIFLVALGTGWQFVFPDVGATFLMGLTLRGARLLSIEPLVGLRLMSCLSGVLTVVLLAKSARYVMPGRAPALAVALLLSGGLSRIFAGHIEVYPLVLAATALYLWQALAVVHGRGTWLSASLALGLAIWLHLSALFLIPSFLVCCWLAPSHPGRSRLRGALMALAVAAMPMLVFLGGLAAAGQHADFVRAWERAMEILGRRPPGPWVIDQWWVRGWGGPPSVGGTDYVFLGPGHRKYLLNACYLLMPFAVPVLVASAVAARRRLLAAPTGAFLATASLSLLVYTCSLRAMWGPFDWDLFAITALAFGAWGLFALTRVLPAPLLRETAVVLLGFQLLFVSVPFLLMGALPIEEAGPFAPGWFAGDLAMVGGPIPDRLVPWL